jgi:hypothetical protein
VYFACLLVFAGLRTEVRRRASVDSILLCYFMNKRQLFVFRLEVVRFLNVVISDNEL